MNFTAEDARKLTAEYAEMSLDILAKIKDAAMHGRSEVGVRHLTEKEWNGLLKNGYQVTNIGPFMDGIRTLVSWAR